MTFDGLESSRAGGQPITLYEFQTGDATFLRFTDAQEDVADGGDVYTPIPIEFGAVTTSGSLDNSEARITVPQDVGLAELYLVYPPEIPVSIVVRIGHFGDPDLKLAFTGTVLSCDRQGSEAILACEPVTAALRRPGLRRPWQLACPYALYRGNCPASEAAATRAEVVQAVANTVLTMNSGWNGPHGIEKYNTGMVKWTNANGGTEARTILRTTTTTIALSGLTRDIAALDTVSVILGCNRQMVDCENLHNVIRDFGGQPFIPLENPWESQATFR